MAEQIPIPLPVEPALTEDDFLMTASNQHAAQMLALWSAAGPLLLLGPQGTGKTHLAAIWQKRTGATPLSLAAFDAARPLPAHALWEDADKTVWTAEAQQRAFHLLNCVKEQGTQLLLTATMPPRDWPLQLADARSRLLAVPVAQLEPPDDGLVAGLLLKHFRDRQLRVGEDALNYLIPRLPRDGAAIAQAVAQLDEAALRGKQGITIPLIRAALKNLLPEK